MRNKVVDNYSHALGYVPEDYMTKKMYDTAVSIYSSTMNLFLNAL